MSEDLQQEPAPPFRGYASFVCDRMSATVFVREPNSFGKIHILAMGFIARNGTVSGLLGAFGLGPQVMQEVLADLVFGEAVRIDLDNDAAVLCEPFASLISTEKPDQIEALLYKTREFKVTWMLDRSTGEVFAERDLSQYLDPPTTRGQVLDPRGQTRDVPDIKKTANPVLAATALPVLEEYLREDDVDPTRVDKIENKRKLPGNVLYVPVVGRRIPGSTVEYLVPEAPGVPPNVREAWTKLLNVGRNVEELLAIETPDEQVPLSPQSLAEGVDAMLAELSSLLQLDLSAASTVDRIDVILRRLKEATWTADEMERSQGEVKVCVGERRVQLEFLDKMIEKARHRVIIGSAFASFNGLSSLLPHMRAAISRGVKFTLVQGIPGYGDEDDRRGGRTGEDEVKELISRLDDKVRSGFNFELSRRPFHAKFVIVDGTEICVSSHNWLTGKPHGGPTEVSILTDAPFAVSRLGIRVSDWLQPGSPERTDLEDTLRRAKRKETRTHFFKKQHAALHEAWDAFAVDPGPAARAVMELQIERFRKLVPAIAALVPTIPVVDAEHRSVLFHLVGASEKSLFISSDGVTESAAGERFGAELQRTLERGVAVTVRWGRQTSALDAPEGRKAVRRLRERLPEVSTALDLPAEPSGNHSKMVVSDGARALISSFNFLSFGATERSDSAFSSEFGLLTCDSKAVAELLRRFPS